MKKFLLMLFPLLLTGVVLAQSSAGTAEEGGGGVSFKMIMNIVFGVMALALVILGIWYFKMKRDNE